jgi:[CysO sulfur-carrier protein]-S-L-cysteine hydrolase
MLRLPEGAYREIIGDALDHTPDECCGLLLGRGDRVDMARPMRNAESESPRTRYVLDSREQFAVMRQAEADGREVIGCFHSHTHTEAYPSPTDIERAGYPEWWYLIVTLKGEAPMLRAYRIIDDQVIEDPIVLEA